MSISFCLWCVCKSGTEVQVSSLGTVSADYCKIAWHQSGGSTLTSSSQTLQSAISFQHIGINVSLCYEMLRYYYVHWSFIVLPWKSACRCISNVLPDSLNQMLTFPCGEQRAGSNPSSWIAGITWGDNLVSMNFSVVITLSALTRAPTLFQLLSLFVLRISHLTFISVSIWSTFSIDWSFKMQSFVLFYLLCTLIILFGPIPSLLQLLPRLQIPRSRSRHLNHPLRFSH